MRHEHLVVTVEAGTKARIETDLDGGETVEAWVADAIDAKLAEDDRSDGGSNEAIRATGDETGGYESDGDDYESDGEENGFDGDENDYDEGFEYVDDCAI